MQKASKSSSLSSYILKPSFLLEQGFKKNWTAQEKLFKHMCNFGSQAEWRKGRSVISSYLDVDTTKYQCRLLSPTPLDCIAWYIMEDSVGERALKRLPQRRLNFIDGCISSYCYIINSPEQLEKIRQANNLASVLCDLESDCIRDKEENKKIPTEVEDNRRHESEEKQIRENEDKLRGLESFESLVRSVLKFGMDHINTLKVKEIRVLLRYHFGSERLKGTPKESGTCGGCF